MKTCVDPLLRTSDPARILPSSARLEIKRAALLVLKWLRRHGEDLMKRSSSRRLRLVETVSLGEKRFISIVQVDGEQLLLGGSSSALAVLAKLECSQPLQQRSNEASFADVYSRTNEHHRDASATPYEDSRR